MLSDEFLNQIFRNNQEKIDRKISYEYHKRLKLIKEQKNEERENIKQGIIAELYYKEGFKDGIDFIIKHIINHFHRYVQHLDDENIEKTSNKVENYYRQTNPEKIKKIYKTKNGILTFLDYQMKNWTEKHIKIK